MKYEKRIVFVFIMLAVILSIIVFRLAKLQIIDTFYKKETIKKTNQIIEILPERGNIYDRNLKKIALSTKINSVYFNTDGFEENKNREKIISKLSTILDIEKPDLKKKMKNKGYIRIKKEINEQEKTQLEKLKKDEETNRITIIVENGRYYTKDNIYSNLIGFLNEDNVGNYGIEMYFNDILFGTPGKTINTNSSNLDTSILSKAGQNIRLTIDEGIQNILYKRGKEAFETLNPKEITLVAMNPQNGEILGMLNFPNFNSNTPREKPSNISQEAWDDLDNEQRLNQFYSLWKNKSINDTYEPGSVFKLITLAAALEENTTDDEHKYNCAGFMDAIDGFVIKCWRSNNPHGTQNISEALTNSCNPAFVDIARELGANNLYKYILGFGFGQKTGVELPGEEKGRIPKSEESITRLDLATLSYGHGISTTPIQMLTAVSAVVNGGYLHQPKILKGLMSDQNEKIIEFDTITKRQVISEKTSEKMRKYMEAVVNDGMPIVKVPGYRVGGKTGTTVKLENGKYNEDIRLHSFASVFPADKPEIVILAMMDESQQQVNPTLSLTNKILADIIDYRKYSPDVKSDNIQSGDEIDLGTIQE